MERNDDLVWPYCNQEDQILILLFCKVIFSLFYILKGTCCNTCCFLTCSSSLERKQNKMKSWTAPYMGKKGGKERKEEREKGRKERGKCERNEMNE